MTDSATRSLPAQNLTNVKHALNDCRMALAAGRRDGDTPADSYLYAATEALMRAVATLAQVVEDQQA